MATARRFVGSRGWHRCGACLLILTCGACPYDSLCLPALPISRCGHAAVELKGRLYVLGGTSLGFPDAQGSRAARKRGLTLGLRAARRHLADVCVWDAEAGSWAACAPMQTGRCRFAAIAAQGRIFAAGGISENGPTALVESWAPGEAEWRFEADLPVDQTSLILPKRALIKEA